MKPLHLALLCLPLVFAISCTPKKRLPTEDFKPFPQTTGTAQTNLHHENLNAVLWMQTAAEYTALTQQAYTTAQLALDEAVDEPSWTASTEQEAAGNFEDLPPAVILDVDETVLDNSPYQAQLIATGTQYSSSSWAAWTAKAQATAIPGALAYCKEAAARGITVFYVTNRKAPEEAATRKNLAALGFPLRQDLDVIITRNEKPEWSASDKTPRRQHVAQNFRILQLVGDNLGDFIEVDGSPAQRQAAATQYASYWGMRWIALPNPSYGSWNSALFHGLNPSPTEEEAQLEHKRSQLRQP